MRVSSEPQPVPTATRGRRRLTTTVAVGALLLSPALAFPGSAATSEAGSGRTAAAVNACVGDTIAPQVTDVRVSTTSVDVTAAAARIAVEVDVTDLAAPGVEPTGVRRVLVSWEWDKPRAGAHFFQPIDIGTGTWRGELVLPRGAEPDTWQLAGVRVVDENGNRRGYEAPGRYVQHPTMPASWQAVVHVTDATPDRQRPQITGLTFAPRAVDTRTHAAYVKVRVQVRDDRKAMGARFGIHRGGDEDYDTYLWTDLQSRGGGVFTGRLKVRRYLTLSGRFAPEDDGEWPALLYVWDANRTASMSAGGMERHGWPSKLSVVSSTRPVPDLTKVTVGDPVRTSAGDARMQVTAVLDGGGAPVVGVEIWSRHLLAWSRGGGGVDLRLVKGTRSHGTWRGALVVPSCSGPGRYGFNAWIDGAAANPWIGTWGMRHRGAPATVTLSWLRGDDVAPTARVGLVAADRVNVVFSEGVKDVLPAVSITDIEYRPIAVSSVVCTTAAGAPAPCTGGEAVIRRAEFALSAPLAPEAGVQVLINETVFVPEVTDGAGNPLNREMSELSIRPPSG